MKCTDQHLEQLKWARVLLMAAGITPGCVMDVWLHHELIRRGRVSEFWASPVDTTVLMLGWINEARKDLTSPVVLVY